MQTAEAVQDSKFPEFDGQDEEDGRPRPLIGHLEDILLAHEKTDARPHAGRQTV